MSGNTAIRMIPDAELIDAARWAARHLILGRLVANSPTSWVHREGKGAGIVSELKPQPSRRRR
jgi:hypothetical protein